MGRAVEAGFWRIAHGRRRASDPRGFDPANRQIGIGEPFLLGDDMDADIARIQRWVQTLQGRNHDVVQPRD